MKLPIYIASLIAICVTSGAYADHKHGPRNECWRDSKYDKHWAYYYCGAQAAKCDGKKSKGHDTVFWQYHGDGFTFRTSPNETYYCCGGTTSAEGKYVRADKWIVKTETIRKDVAGGTCNKQIKTNACGETHEQDCTTPDSCSTGLVLRNKECVAPCGGEEIFESPTSNKCISCKTTTYQGVSLNHETCIKCDPATEFFNRETKTCIKKSELKQYSKQPIYDCWQCPPDILKNCVDIMSTVNKTGKTGADRIQEIKNISSFDGNNIDIIKACNLK